MSKGEVSLEIKVLDTSELGTQVRFEVRDTGIGIPADRLKSLLYPLCKWIRPRRANSGARA